jgi:hypothetical protein
MGIEQKISALEVQPRLTGTVVSEGSDGMVLQVGGTIVEIARRHIAELAPKGTEVELTLNSDAEILVSTPVSMEKGFIVDNVFGVLLPGIRADACNCNCNCPSGNCNCNCNCSERQFLLESEPGLATTQAFRRPFTGGARS